MFVNFPSLPRTTSRKYSQVPLLFWRPTLMISSLPPQSTVTPRSDHFLQVPSAPKMHFRSSKAMVGIGLSLLT